MKISYIFTAFILYFLTLASLSFAGKPAKDMVFVKGGCFNMGTDKVFIYVEDIKNTRERPVHKVCLDGFYLDKYETSQKKWQKVMKNNPAWIKNDDFPVDHLKWEQANAYCNRRGHRLPTEAEWEYAARAGSNTVNSWGDEIDGDYAWYNVNSGRQPRPAGQKKPNAWGLHDMNGSVWEWTSDWYLDNYYKVSPKMNPKGPKKRQSFHVIRGGSWVEDESFIRATVRYPGLADMTETFLVGVRCAYTPKK